MTQQKHKITIWVKLLIFRCPLQRFIEYSSSSPQKSTQLWARVGRVGVETKPIWDGLGLVWAFFDRNVCLLGRYMARTLLGEGFEATSAGPAALARGAQHIR